MRGVIESTLHGNLLLEVGIGGPREPETDGICPHRRPWSQDRVCDQAHYNPLVCGGGPHYQASAPRDSGAYYNPLVCGEGLGLLGCSIFTSATGDFYLSQLMRGVIESTLHGDLLLEVGKGGPREPAADGMCPHGRPWSQDRVRDWAHYNPLVCGEAGSPPEATATGGVVEQEPGAAQGRRGPSVKEGPLPLD